MLEFLLLTTQKNDVLEAIQRQGFAPDEFDWDKVGLQGDMMADDGLVSVLRHKSSGYRFFFDMRRENVFWATYRPGLQSPQEHIEAPAWPYMLELVKKWAANVRREVGAPDLWGQWEFQTPVRDSGAAFEDDMKPLSADEKRQIQEGLANLRTLIAEEFRPIEERLGEIEKRLQYLSDATERLNRFDWRGAAFNTALTIGACLSLDTEGGSRLFGLFKQALSAIPHLLQQ